MENPMSWDATHKIINNALYKKTAKTPARNQRAKSVVDALKVAKLMKKDVDGLEGSVQEVLDDGDKQASAGMCGRSCSGQVYDKLKEMGVL